MAEGTKESGSEMTFFEHIGELRKRIILSLVGIGLGCALTGTFVQEIMKEVLLKPAISANLSLQNLTPFGQPFLYFKVILTTGIIVAFPWILYQLWKFIAPGLYENEKKWARKITFFTSLCFFSGVSFAYFVMIPTMLEFAASFGTDYIKNQIDINEFFSFITMLLLGAGLLFEMPMITYILARVRILTPGFMCKYRRHAAVLILIIAAVITPTPDPVSQLIFAVPLYVLYEISIWIARVVYREDNKSGNSTAE